MAGEDSELMLNQARIFILRGRFDRASDPLARLIAADPKNSQAKSLLAICRARGKFTQEAERIAKDAIAAEPTSAYPHLALAVVRAEQGRRDDAAEEFNTALSISRDDAFILFQHALFLKSIGKPAEALSAAEKAAARDPEMEGVQKLVEELRAAMPKKEAEPLPEQGEVHNAWFFAKMPDGWGYVFDSERNVHLFHDEQVPGANISIVPLTGTQEELTGLKNSFFGFVESDSGAKPARMRERKMRLGTAAEAQVAVTENGVRTRRTYIGYAYKDVFYVLTSSCPEQSLPQCMAKFDYLIDSFLPKGLTPENLAAQAAAPAPKPAGMKEIALHAVVGLIGALMMLAGLYFLALVAVSKDFLYDMGAAYLLVAIVGYLLLATLIFRFSPKLVYILHLVYFLLVAACAILGYLAMGKGGLLGTAMSVIGIGLAAVSLLAVISVLLYGRMKGKELDAAYPEIYGLLLSKYGRK